MVRRRVMSPGRVERRVIGTSAPPVVISEHSALGR
jgi:hypothetical protein